MNPDGQRPRRQMADGAVMPMTLGKAGRGESGPDLSQGKTKQRTLRLTMNLHRICAFRSYGVRYRRKLSKPACRFYSLWDKSARPNVIKEACESRRS